MWILALLGGWATAQAEPSPPPEVASIRPRIYPSRLYRDRTVARTCVLRVTLDERGRGHDPVPVDCPAELQRRSARTVKGDRWVLPVEAGTQVEVVVTYEPPASTLDFPTWDAWRRRSEGQCELLAHVEPDGSVRPDRSTGCELTIASLAPTPSRWIQRTVPLLCPLTFTVRNGQMVALDLFRCPLFTWSAVRAGLHAWTWPDDGTRAWSVLLSFEGPDPGPRSERFPKPL